MTVFNKNYASQYDSLYIAKDYVGECDLIETVSARFFKNGVQRILDMGCGTGGHALELATRGYDVSGVDLSPSMLAVAASKAQTADLIHQPRWFCGDVRTFVAGKDYDLAIMMFAVVSYLESNHDVLAGLKNIRAQLRPGSLFLCDFWYGPAVLNVKPGDRIRVQNGDNGCVIRSASTSLDSLNHVADVTFQLWTIEGRSLIDETRETHRMRFYFPQEFRLFLEVSGFECLVLSPFPRLDEPLTDESWNAFCVAKAV